MITLTASQLVTGNKVKLRPKSLEDSVNDFTWQTDNELCRLDATSPLNCSYEEYIRQYQEVFRNPHLRCTFAIETLKGRHIGNCSFFNVDEAHKEAEMGIMIGDKRFWNQGFGTDAVCTALNFIFSSTELDTIRLKTLDWNIRAHRCFQKCGFAVHGNLIVNQYRFLLMRTNRTDHIHQM